MNFFLKNMFFFGITAAYVKVFFTTVNVEEIFTHSSVKSSGGKQSNFVLLKCFCW